MTTVTYTIDFMEINHTNSDADLNPKTLLQLIVSIDAGVSENGGTSPR